MLHKTQRWFASDTTDNQTDVRRIKYLDKNANELLIVKKGGLTGITFRTATESMVARCARIPGLKQTCIGSTLGPFGDIYLYEIMLPFTSDVSVLALMIEIINENGAIDEIKNKVYGQVGLRKIDFHIEVARMDTDKKMTELEVTIRDLNEIIAKQNQEIARLKSRDDVSTKQYNPATFGKK